MKKILSLILTLFCVLSLVGCGRSMDDIIKNESSITGVVEEVYNNSILISIQTDAYPYGAYCDVSLDAENKDDMVDFNIGDEVIVFILKGFGRCCVREHHAPSLQAPARLPVDGTRFSEAPSPDRW